MRIRDDARWSDLPIVLFTASMDTEELAARVGKILVLEKPYKARELVATLRAAIDARAPG